MCIYVIEWQPSHHSTVLKKSTKQGEHSCLRDTPIQMRRAKCLKLIGFMLST